MTTSIGSFNDYFPYCWDEEEQQEQWPVIHQPRQRLQLLAGTSHPELYFSPIEDSMPVWLPSKRRATLDRFCKRLEANNFTGSDLAIEYLHEKYSQNLTAATISQAGGVILSFLGLLEEYGVDIWEVTRKDISRYVERDQDNGLKTSAIRAKLRSIYTFIHFLVDKTILPYELLHKKIRIKPEELLPRAIPAQDIKSLLAVITSIRDRALILLLLRTGMRIGELLNVKISDIHLSERKILLYQGSKNYRGRVVYFSEDAEKALRQWLEIRNTEKTFLFYSHSRQTISYVAAWTVMKKALEVAGLSNKGYSLHCLRHTFATDMLNAGLRLEVLQQLLGHQSAEITRRYAKMSDVTRETEYFKAIAAIERGGMHEPHRVNSELQEVFEEKKLIHAHGKKLSA